jgi:UDP-glucose 4-epimerase
MTAKRVLITGVSTYWGGRLAQALERNPAVEAVIGVSPDDPTCELDRTEFVRVGTQHALLRRIVRAAAIDTVVDTRLIVDSAQAPARVAHENNVIGTMNILAACGGAESPVRKVVVKSSAHFYGSERDDPAFFAEDMERPHPPRTALEKDIVEAERAVRAFAERDRSVCVSVLRFANALGPELRTSHTALFSLPVVPSILGFDPRYQFIHADDIHGVLEHATRHDLPGVYNAAGDGVLALSEVASLLGKRLAPVLPPWGTGLASAALRRLGLRLPPEMLQQLRYGRGLDNRRLKAAGYAFRATSRETVLALAHHLRTRHITEADGGYRYEREVEEFLRWSPSVRGGDRLGLGRLSPEQLAELARALESLPGRREPEDRAPDPLRAGAPGTEPPAS